jgi:hypothetical protein
MWKFVTSFVFGPFINLFKGALDYRTQKSLIEADTLKERIHADIELNRIKVAMAQVNAGNPLTRWIVPGFAYPLVLWWICVIADSIYQFPHWNVARLPDPLMDWAGAIIMSFFAVRGLEMVANPARGMIDKVKGLFTHDEAAHPTRTLTPRHVITGKVVVKQNVK